jgi:type IV secretory pathway VirB10-like protein
VNVDEPTNDPERTGDFDPHATKIAPDDPRLRITQRSSRRLRKGPAVALALGLGCVVGASLVLAMAPNKRAAKKVSIVADARPAVPDPILKAADPPNKDTNRPADARPAVPAETDTTARGGVDHGRYSEAALRQRSTEAFWAARAAGILASTGTIPDDFEAKEPEQRQPVLSNESTPEAVAQSGAQSPEGDPNLQGRKNEFLNSRKRDDGYLHATLHKPRSPFEVKAGTIIPGTLITGINSDLPGPVVAQVRENVYDTVTGQYLLIPQGARLLASYDSMIVWGQERVLLCWHRLVLPNGDSLDLECMPGADLAGAAGLTDEVDEHWWRIVKGAMVASLLSAATTAAGGNTHGYNPTVPQLWARGAASEVATAGEHITRRNLMIQPTITVRPGWSMNVMVTRDMIVPPYDATGEVSGRLIEE